MTESSGLLRLLVDFHIDRFEGLLQEVGSYRIDGRECGCCNFT